MSLLDPVNAGGPLDLTARQYRQHEQRMPELRIDPVSGRPVILAPDRSRRPFDEPVDGSTSAPGPCPFCRGQEARTPQAVDELPDESGQWTVRVIPNRFPALQPQPDAIEAVDAAGIRPGYGVHEVVVESPDHHRRMTELSVLQFERIVRVWRQRVLDLQRMDGVAQVIVFKNSGAAAGASLEHVHSQILAVPFVTSRMEALLTAGTGCDRDRPGSNVWCEALRDEREAGLRIIEERGGSVLFCPRASRFPGEMCLMPVEPQPDFGGCDEAQLREIAGLLQSALLRLERGFSAPAFNLVVQTAPPADPRRTGFQWHIEIIPRLTGIGGFELGSGTWINILAPEDAAARLRLADSASL